KPTTGQAPISEKTSAVDRDTTPTTPSSTARPRRPSDRCGVRTTEKKGRSGSPALPFCMAPEYRSPMADDHPPEKRKSVTIKRKAKAIVPGLAAAPQPKPLKKPLPKAPAGAKAKREKPDTAYSEAELRAIFERFRLANPEPKGELDHVNAF